MKFQRIQPNFSALIAITHIVTSTRLLARCPKDLTNNSIEHQPCECFPDSSILCTQLNHLKDGNKFLSLLTNFFEDLSRNSNSLNFTSIIISDTSIDHIPDNVFKNISFKKIKFESNFNLRIKNFDRNSIVSSSASLMEFISINPVFRMNEVIPFDDQESDTDSGSFCELFDDFKLIRTITISYHKDLNHIPRNCFGRNILQNLQTLSLNDNSIETIGDYSFYKLPNLTELNLSFNNIKKIANKAFSSQNISGRSQLSIDLSFNQLDQNSFEDGSLNHFNHMFVHIDLSHNYIEYMNESVFRPFLFYKTNHFITMKKNPVKCNSCQMTWMRIIRYRRQVLGMTCSEGSDFFARVNRNSSLSDTNITTDCDETVSPMVTKVSTKNAENMSGNDKKVFSRKSSVKMTKTFVDVKSPFNYTFVVTATASIMPTLPLFYFYSIVLFNLFVQ